MPDCTPHPSSSLLPLTVRRATVDDRVVLERLWLLFRHDMSRFTGGLPRPDGTFRSEWLESALASPHWAAFLAHCGDSPVGFAFVRSLDRQPSVLNSLFLVAGARRSGASLALARHVVAAFPGSWEVAFQQANRVAVRFWRRVAEIHDPAWTEELRAVPDRPELAPDSWISFRSDRR